MTGRKTRQQRHVALHGDRRPLAITAVVLAVTVALWALWATPNLRDASAAGEELAAVEQTAEANMADLSALQSGQETSAAALMARVRVLDALFPTDVAVLTSLTQVEDAAQAAGVTLTQATRGEDVTVGNATAQSVSVQVSGTADQLRGFLAALVSGQRLMLAESPTFTYSTAGDTGGTTGGTAGGVTMAATLLLWTHADPPMTSTAP